MKRLLLFLLVGLALAIGIRGLLNFQSGHVLIHNGDWRIEMNLLVLISLTIGSALLLFFSLYLVSKIFSVSSSANHWLRSAKHRKATKNTNAGLQAYLEGNWNDASKLLKSSANHSDNPVINYLAAAHSANELGQTKEAEQLLSEAYSHTDESDFAVGLSKARLALEQNELETSLATLIRLKTLKPNHPSVLKLLRSVYLKLEDWNQLIQLLPDLKKIPGEDKERLKRIEEDAWRKLFTGKAEELGRIHQGSKGSESLAELWKRMPNKLRFETDILCSYAEQLIQMNKTTEAEALLRKMLAKHWDDKLVLIYGKILTDDPNEQLIVAEKWLKERPNNAALLLTLGRIAQQSELWGKAKEYLIASRQQTNSIEVCAELCRLNLHLKSQGFEDKIPEQEQSENVQELVNALNLPPISLKVQ